MMDQLIQSVTGLVGEEYQRAAEEHGAAARSPHEGYGLIKEEIEEADVQMAIVNQRVNAYWDSVKADAYPTQRHFLNEIKRAAVLRACELIQVAAMADKALAGYEKEEQ